MKKYIIANWKMERSHKDTLDWLHKNKTDLEDLADKANIVFCPSFTELESSKKVLNKIFIGAQNCAPEKSGALTGEISAVTLKELGCDFCIIGHSERKKFFGETNQEINKKLKILLEEKIVPIVCIGESKEDFDSGLTVEVLNRQLEEIFDGIETPGEIFIAYEPVWAIGSGITPDKSFLDKVVASLSDKKFNILYGGSVNDEIAKLFIQNKLLSGFLIGRASLDFQTLKKIVLSIV